MHALADVHDTPDSRLYCSAGGLGVVWIVQLVPFHRSANVTSVPALLLVVADGGARARRRARHPRQLAGVSAGRVRGRLDRPARPVPPLRQRHLCRALLS